MKIRKVIDGHEYGPSEYSNPLIVRGILRGWLLGSEGKICEIVTEPTKVLIRVRTRWNRSRQNEMELSGTEKEIRETAFSFLSEMYSYFVSVVYSRKGKTAQRMFEEAKQNGARDVAKVIKTGVILWGCVDETDEAIELLWKMDDLTEIIHLIGAARDEGKPITEVAAVLQV
ncbi:MAG: hypothetical protein WC242_01615 [Candidatus Paceibacterota bacterium]